MKRKMGRPEIQERAMKLMEALSGVDEELLERCEESGVRKKAPIPLRRYARGWAAVLCLAVVGVAGWGGYRLVQENGREMNSEGAYDEAGLEEIEVIMENTVPSQEPEAGNQEAAPREAEEGVSGSGHASPNEGGDNGMGADAAEKDRPSEESTDKEREEKSDDSTDKQNESVMDEACMADNTRKLTEAEARAQEVLGGYVPKVLPRGYAFESAVTNPDSPEENLRLCWTRGMDSIMLSFTKVENAPITVDVEKPETYDERLYEVPHAETVPEEYRQSVNHPVFAREDFSLEIIRSRMISYNDSGDTDAPRGNFSVLCSDGVLVVFSGRGTAEEIWEMFCSMEDF